MSLSLLAGEDNQFDSDSIYDIKISPNSGLEFKSEKVTLSPDHIIMEYGFHNAAKSPLTTEIIFPLPSNAPNGYLNQFSPTKFNFQASVEGTKIPYPLKARAFLDSKEITSELKELNITYVDYYPQGSPASLKEALKRGYVYEKVERADFEDDESPMVTVLYPSFTIKLSFSWKQTFPPGPTNIKISYKPGLGTNEGLILDSAKWDAHLPDYQFKLDSPLDKRSQVSIETLRKSKYTDLPASYFKFTLPQTDSWPKGIENFELFASGSQIILLDINGQLMSDIESYTFKKENFKPIGQMKVQFVGREKGPLHTDNQFTKKINGPANCRLKPYGKIVKSILDQETVILKERKDGWYHIFYKGHNCWTSRNNLRF